MEEVEGVVEEDEEGEGDDHIIRQTKTSCGLENILVVNAPFQREGIEKCKHHSTVSMHLQSNENQF